MAAAAGEASKVKLLCSFGGKILPRPGDATFRYAGGHTRLLSFPRDSAFPDLLRKMSDIFYGSAPYSEPPVLKYQLPGEDLDALITISTPDDFYNMLEEYDRLSTSDTKVRVFLFHPSPTLDPPLFADDPSHRYIHAINNAPVDPLSLRRKDSTSTHDSEASELHEPSVDSPKFPTATPTAPQSMYVPQQEAFGYVNYVAPQQFGYVAVAPPGPYMSGFAPRAVGYMQVPGDLGGMAVQSLPHLPPLPQYSNVQAVNADRYGGMQLWHQVAMPSHLQQQQQGHGLRRDDCTFCQKALPHAHSDTVVHDIVSSGTLSNATRDINPLYHSLRPEDVINYQLQQHRGGEHRADVMPTIFAPPANAYDYPQIPMTATDVDRIASNRAENSDQNRFMYSQGISGFPADLSTLYGTPLRSHNYQPVVGDQSCIQQPPQLPAVHHPAMQDLLTSKVNTVGLNQPNVDMHHGLESSYRDAAVESLFSIARPVEGMMENLHINVDLPGVHEQRRTSAAKSGASTPRDTSSEVVVPAMENMNYSEPVEAKDLLSSGFVSTCILPEGSSIKPAEQLLPSNLDISYTNNLQAPGQLPQLFGILLEGSSVKPAEQLPPSTLDIDYMGNIQIPGQVFPHLLGNNGSFPHLPVAAGEPPIPHKRLLGMANANKILAAERREQISAVPPSNILADVSALPSGSLLPPLGIPAKINESNDNETKNPIPLESLFSDRDSWGIQQIAHVQPPKPVRVASGESLASKDSGVETRATPRGESSHAGVAENGNSHKPPPDLNIDPLLDLITPKRDSADAQINKGVQTGIESLAASVLQPSMLSAPVVAVTQVLQHSVPVGAPVPVAAAQVLQPSLPAVAAVPIVPVTTVLQSSVPSVPVVPAISIAQPPVPAAVAVAFVPAASVLQTVVPTVPAVGGLPYEMNEPAESYITQGVHNAMDTQMSEDSKPKPSDKLNHGFQITEDIERLQIIKNSDLEELRELGSGTFGTVYHGKWRGTDVAFKRINDRCFAGKPADQERMRNDFWNEACHLADLHHPNVVAFYGIVLDGPGGSVATVTEYMVNGSLRNALQRTDKPLDMRKCLLIAMDVAFGMEYLHGRKIVHFDLKSDNLLVNLRDPHRPICKVGDLGLSKVKCQTLISGGVRGTLPWMAPELLSGDSNLVSEKVDVFSFGIVMWELLTKEEPYADLHYGAIIGGIVNNTLRPPIPESCDPEWSALMEKCWSADPSERPSFTEVAAKLRAMAASYPSRKGQQHPNLSAALQAQK